MTSLSPFQERLSPGIAEPPKKEFLLYVLPHRDESHHEKHPAVASS